jgi:hypothetical protein
MVVNDLDRSCTVQSPLETNTELIVYSDTVLADPFALQRFEPVARRNPQIVKLCRRVYLVQFSKRHTPQISRQETPSLDRVDTVKNVFRP